MVTLKADDRRRVQIPTAKPGQVFAFESQADGSVVLTPVKADRHEPFPRGSLADEVKDMNRESAGIAKATVMGVPKVCR